MSTLLKPAPRTKTYYQVYVMYAGSTKWSLHFSDYSRLVAMHTMEDIRENNDVVQAKVVKTQVPFDQFIKDMGV